VVASGAFDFPREPRIDGSESVPRMILAREWRGPAGLAGRVLVIGAATSAIEIAEQAASAGLAVTVAARDGRVHVGPRRLLGRDVHDFAFLLERLPVALGPRFCRGRQALPAGDRGFRAARRAGRIAVRPTVERFEAGEARFSDGSRERCDVVVWAAGYRYETPFLPEEVARRAPNRALAARDNESISWPGLYVVGHACARGFDSQFLRGIARDAPRLAHRMRARGHR
jgi:putative flavoprotein involved in K+ transport